MLADILTHALRRLLAAWWRILPGTVLLYGSLLTHFALALASLGRQTMTDWEAVVVDDCSTDGTSAILERLAQNSNPRVIVDTAGLPPEATELANRLARQIAELSRDDLRALQTALEVLDRARVVAALVVDPAQAVQISAVIRVLCHRLLNQAQRLVQPHVWPV